MTTINLKIEFNGGLELLFGNKRSHTLLLPAFIPSVQSTSAVKGNARSPTESSPASPPESRSTDLTYLMHHLRTNLLTERPELFMDGDTVRPGILVMINDTDWELEGEGAYELKNGDEIVFISTLHGG